MAAFVGAHIVRPLRVGNLLPPRITVEISAAARRWWILFLIFWW